MNEETIFTEAVRRADRADRAAFLDAACGGDDDLRRRVEALLSAHQAVGSFLEPLVTPPPSAVGSETPPAPGEGMASGPPGYGSLSVTQADTAAVVGGRMATVPVGDPIRSREPSPGENATGTIIGPYQLLEPIGEGGMGTVYMAEQTAPVRRLVALKLVKPGMDSRQVLARFQAERQALALMDHPNIARVLDAGTTEQGRPYFVMELVKGVPITQFCDERRLTPSERLELFLPVCQAVQHAHQKGIIHRDIKPSNVLVALYDGKPVPKVIDFGVAKAIGPRLTEATLYTSFGMVVGTPEYMSPEQTALNQLDIDTRSDIYSLGILLYELLTGTTPLDRKRLNQAALLEVLRVIREEEPPRPSARLSTAEELPSIAANRSVEPRKLTVLVRGELDWIVMKALEKDRTRRYETADDLAADLRHHLDDEPVTACPPSAGYRLRKLARRNKRLLMTIAVVILALVAGTAVATWQSVRAWQAEGLAERRLAAETVERQRAVAAERAGAERFYEAKIQEVRARRRGRSLGQRFDSLAALREANRAADYLGLGAAARLELRDEAVAVLALPDLRLIGSSAVLGSDDVDWIVYDLDVAHFAVSGPHGSVRVGHTSDGTILSRFETGWEGMTGCLFSPNGTLLVAVQQPGFTVWDWRRPVLRFRVAIPGLIPEVRAFSPDGRRLAVGKSDGTILVYDVSEGRVWKRLTTRHSPACVAFSPTGDRLAVTAWSASHAETWDLATGAMIRKVEEKAVVRDVTWTGSGHQLALGCGDSEIHLWNADQGREMARLRGHQTRPSDLHSDRANRWLCSWAWDHTVRLWDVTAGQEQFRLPGTHGRLSADGSRLVALRDQRLQAWELITGRVYQTLPTCSERTAVGLSHVDQLALSPGGRWLAVCGVGGVALYDLASGEPTAAIPMASRPEDVLFTQDDSALLVSGQEGIQRWPLIHALDGSSFGTPTRLAGGWTGRLGTDAERRILVYEDSDRGAQLITLGGTGEPGQALPHPQCGNVAMSPDGAWVVSAPHNGRGVRVWETATGRLVCDLAPRQHTTVALAFHPDGHWLAVGFKGHIRFWRPGPWTSGVPFASAGELEGWNPTWSPEGRFLAYVLPGQYGVRLLDGNTGRTLATLEAPDGLQVHRLAFTPDGRRLVVGSEWPSHLRVWDLAALRQELSELGLDWEASPPSPDPAAPPLEVPSASVNDPCKGMLEALKTTNQSPAERKARHDRARKLYVAGDFAGALREFRHALELDPNDVYACRELAWIYAVAPARFRDPAAALAMAQRAVQLDPNSPAVQRNLGLAYLRNDRPREAVEAIRRAIKIRKSGHLTHDDLTLALALYGSGAVAAAQKVYGEVIRRIRATRRISPLLAREHEVFIKEAEALIGLDAETAMPNGQKTFTRD